MFKRNEWTKVDVTKIIDGDTFKIEFEGTRFSIRVYGCDCPEIGQPFANEATQFLEKFLENKPIEIKFKKFDRYGRCVAMVNNSRDQDLTSCMLTFGLATWESKNCKELYYAKLERIAKAAKIGIWSQLKNEAPNKYRNRKFKKKTNATYER